jgi:hypothetical protein
MLYFTTKSLGVSFENFDVYGNTNYSEKESKSLTTNLNLEHKFILHEPNHKKYLIYIGNKLTIDYDHFFKNYKTNTFTTIGIDF